MQDCKREKEEEEREGSDDHELSIRGVHGYRLTKASEHHGQARLRLVNSAMGLRALDRSNLGLEGLELPHCWAHEPRASPRPMTA
ncbi:hypothetical protein CRG98_011085 [Punica granatum]|uniref:Uncharacterized protein n=1 Tax=Punica granatum TaxID=22663 RepID=A0A2I0KL47_PUNGR|nr:hypothetical protein CRG98_011085 [Punica granatum]